MLTYGFASVYSASAFNIKMQEMVSVQMMPIAKNTLITYLYSDSTKEKTSQYIPLTLSLGMNLAMFGGYFHTAPKFSFEMNMTGNEFTFRGMGGALAFEIHPFKKITYDPHVYCNLGLLRMSHLQYGGHGYNIDFGVGAVFALSSTTKISPFIAFTPLSKWQQRKQIGYSIEFPNGGAHPSYAGHDCRHVGLRIGFSILFRFLER